MTANFSEDALIEQPIIALFESLHRLPASWQSFSPASEVPDLGVVFSGDVLDRVALCP